MNGLTAALLGRACRIFLTLAYPHGNIPPARRAYSELQPDQALEPLLAPPVCQVLPTPNGGIRGYAFRLGCSAFPHMKLRVIDCGEAVCVFDVDTHDALTLEPEHPDAAGWARLQAANRQLKHQIERAWEDQGLLTFNGLLRDGLRSGE